MEFDPEKLIRPRPLLLLAELFILPAAVLAVLAAPILGSFTVLAILGKLFYLRFLLTFEETETSSQGFKRKSGLPR